MLAGTSIDSGGPTCRNSAAETFAEKLDVGEENTRIPDIREEKVTKEKEKKKKSRKTGTRVKEDMKGWNTQRHLCVNPKKMKKWKARTQTLPQKRIYIVISTRTVVCV